MITNEQILETMHSRLMQMYQLPDDETPLRGEYRELAEMLRQLFAKPNRRRAVKGEPPGGILHAIDQADVALGVAGQTEDDIFRVELKQARVIIASMLAERNECQTVRGVVSGADIDRAEAAAMKIKHNKETWFPCTRRRLRAALEAHEATKLELPAASWRPKTTAPRDGSMVRLLVRFTDNATEDSLEPLPTIGSYCEGTDAWQFAGWDWQQDCFTGGEGEIVGWLPMVESHEAGRKRNITPEEAKDIAVVWAKAQRPSYYSEPFTPHAWVIDAILYAANRQGQTAESARVPDGWQLVPETISVPMYRAFMKATNNRVDDYGFNDAYRAMLAAAPTPPQGDRT